MRGLVKVEELIAVFYSVYFCIAKAFLRLKCIIILVLYYTIILFCVYSYVLLSSVLCLQKIKWIFKICCLPFQLILYFIINIYAIIFVWGPHTQMYSGLLLGLCSRISPGEVMGPCVVLDTEKFLVTQTFFWTPQ